MPLTLIPPAVTQATDETDGGTTPLPSCHRDGAAVLPLCASDDVCPMTGRDSCPDSQAEIDKCNAC